LKAILCLLILGTVLVFVVGFVKVVHAVDSIPVELEKEAQKQRDADKRRMEWLTADSGSDLPLYKRNPPPPNKK
jgi:hypothetical protein